MKSYITLLIGTFISLSVMAQEEEQPVESPALLFKSSKLYGKILDPNSGKGLEAASVQLYRVSNDSLVDGMLTKSNGDFSLSKLSSGSQYRLLITALGFEEHVEYIETTGRGEKYEKDLGDIYLQPKIKELADVTIIATKPALEMGIDRKIFNVAKSLNATGGSAIDIMRNIPSVSVDVDGNVQLRNASPQIFVDGRPTVLTLDQIPADNIEKVELITNPSAKYDAASGAGIINVVLKKDKRYGLNGIVSGSVGIPKLAGGNANVNLREGNLNFFLSGGYNQSGGIAKGEAYRENKQNGVVQNYFDQYTNNDRMRRFNFINFGFDYHIDNRNSISISQTFGGGRFSGIESQEQIYYTGSKELDYYGYRNGNSLNKFNRNGTRFNFKRTYPKQGKELTADISYNRGKRSGNSTVVNSYINPDGTINRSPHTVQNDGGNSNHQVTFQSDYANPLDENRKLEFGVRSYHNFYRSSFNVYSIDNNDKTKLPLSNNYKYSEMINAVYGTYSQKIGNFSYQLGLRAEHSRFDGLLIDSAYKFGYQYPSGLKNIMNALFPSLYLTQRINETDQVQFNFSRRIRRPDFWQMSPFIEISDPFNLRQGNPAIQPEFINSFEANYSKSYEGGNLLGSLFWRNNPHDITQYSDTITTEKYLELETAGVDPNAILNTFINAGTTNRYGAELTLQQKWGSSFEITPSANLQYRTVEATVGNVDLSNEGFNWNGKLTANYKIKAPSQKAINNLSFQVIGEYESARVIPQGRMLPQYGLDFAIRKDFLKNNRATATFSVNDVLNSRRWGTIYDTEDFYQDSYRRWSVRTFRLTLSYKFGNADFSLLNRNRSNNNYDEG
ncbi:MAG: TonB-dependent receptor [Chitinophagaceae bacterium]|nr:TonB-dependent receptor [Chitinophagaceae bacterium]MCW5929376.1 TonB-dependent receptor [Chitinophagaceae bacterium]